LVGKAGQQTKEKGERWVTQVVIPSGGTENEKGR